MDEESPTVMLATNVNPETAERFKAYCARQERTVSQMLRLMIKRSLNRDARSTDA